MATELALYQPQPLERNPAAVYAAGLKPTGRRSMLSKLNRVAAMLGYEDASAVPWEELRFQHTVAIRTRLQEEGLACGTVNCTLSALKGVARAAFNLGLIPVDEYQRIREVKDLRYHRELSGRRVLTNEIQDMLKVCERDRRPQGRRDAAILAVLIATGLRRSELVGLRMDDYNPDGGEILVRGKGDKERKVYVASQPKVMLDIWLAIRGPEPGALFCPIDQNGKIDPGRGAFTAEALSYTLRRRARRAGVKRFSPHDLRRTFVSNVLAAGADLAIVAKFVGHANVSTTAKYDRREEEAKRKLAYLIEIPQYKR